MAMAVGFTLHGSKWIKAYYIHVHTIVSTRVTTFFQLTVTRPEKQIRRKTIVGVPGEVREVLSKDAKDKLWRMLKRSQKSCCKSLAI